MEQWAQEHVDLLGPATPHLKRNGEGEINFIALRGWLDCEPAERDGRPGVEFSWQ
jgi:hypothetical protein